MTETQLLALTSDVMRKLWLAGAELADVQLSLVYDNERGGYACDATAGAHSASAFIEV